MYVTSAWSIVHAIDARTGRGLWVYDPEVDRAVGAKACCDVINRGVAVYGRQGVRRGDRRPPRRRRREERLGRLGESHRRPVPALHNHRRPRAANGLVYIGNGGAEYGVRGYVSAYDTGTGALRWRFYTVPGDPSKGPDGAASDGIMARAAATWTGEWWKGGGGGTAWDALVYDSEFDQLLVGVGNGSPWNQQSAPPAGATTSSWPRSSPSTRGPGPTSGTTKPRRARPGTTPRPSPSSSPTSGSTASCARSRCRRPRTVSSTWWTGRTESSFRPSRSSRCCPTQDTSKGAPLSLGLRRDQVTGRPVENPVLDTSAARRSSTRIRTAGTTGTRCRSVPQTGLVYLPMHDMAIRLHHAGISVKREGFKNLGVVIGGFPDDTAVREAIRSSTVGALLGWDPVAQREVWRAKRAARGTGARWPWRAGWCSRERSMATSWPWTRAGTKLWSFDNQAATLAGPISYEVGGEQYVAVPAGYGSAFFMIEGWLAPKEGATPSTHASMPSRWAARRPNRRSICGIPTPKPPALTTTADAVRTGGAALRRPILPHLPWGRRRSPVASFPTCGNRAALQDAEAYGNERSWTPTSRRSGMPRFEKYLSPGAPSLSAPTWRARQRCSTRKRPAESPESL